MPTITMKRLGRMGRWGNQLFQYMFIRDYACKNRIKYEVPSWVGQNIFGLLDPKMKSNLPTYFEQPSGSGGSRKDPRSQPAWNFPMPPDSYDAVDSDYHGYCQFHTSYYRFNRSFLRGLFYTLNSHLYHRTRRIRKAFEGRHVIGLHLRRGDTGRGIFYLTPNEWYLQWLKEHWDSFENPLLFITSEDPGDVMCFSGYDPITSSDLLYHENERYENYNYLSCDLLDPTSEELDWFPDWYALTLCNTLLIGESTFGFSAAMLGQPMDCWRSCLSKQSFTKIDPWDSYPLLREHLDDYPNIPNTFYRNNPKWVGGEVTPTQN